MPAKYKVLKAKKINIDDSSYVVVKLTGKVPAKIVRELKRKFNEAVSTVVNPVVTEQQE